MSGIVGGNLGRGSGLVKAGAVDDNSVTLAKMAGLARGKLIYGDASGDPAALAVGGADEVLTHDGTDFDWAAASGGGITAASQWRITSHIAAGNTAGTDFSSNWEVSDSNAYGSLGSAMSESSGVFTFPSTGYWYVVFNMMSSGGGSAAQYQYGKILTTTDDSSYTVASYSTQSFEPVNYTTSCTADLIIDVTDASNVKVKFQYQSQSSGGDANILGWTSGQGTGATFIRLGDT